MKHIFFLLVVCCLSKTFVYSQTPLRFRAGLSLGAVATDIPGMDTRDVDSDFKKLGFSFGGLINTQFSKNTLQLEINFTQKGSQQDPDTLNEGYYRLNLNYIDIPLIFRHKIHVNIRKKPMDRLEVEGGVSVERLVGYSFTDATNYPGQVNKNAFNNTTASILAGLNFNFSQNLYFCLRYSNSFIPALKRQNIPLHLIRYAYNSGNNQVVLFSVKYVFGSPNPTVSDGKGSKPAGVPALIPQ